jgi:hypothetical protein
MLTVILVLSGCQDDDIITLGTGQIIIEATTTSGTNLNLNGRTAQLNHLSFDGGKIIIREIVFDGDLDNGNSVSITEEQIIEINYKTGTLSPEIILEVTAGLYRDVYLGIELQDDGASPSITLEGSYTNNEGMEFPLKFEFISGEVFEASSDMLAINKGEKILGKIAFDALRWFSNVTASDMEEATLTEGNILINESNNTDIYELVADQIDYATEVKFE